MSLRPTGFSEFVGQAPARANLEVFIAAAKQRKAALDHVLFVGPPGLGKTTLAQIVARELGVGFRATSGPVITFPRLVFPAPFSPTRALTSPARMVTSTLSSACVPPNLFETPVRVTTGAISVMRY